MIDLLRGHHHELASAGRGQTTPRRGFVVRSALRLVLSVSSLASCLIALPAPVEAQSGTDIHVARIQRDVEAVRVSVPINASRRAGYDNQPAFVPGEDALLFTSYRDGQADVYRMELDTFAVTQVTNTSESEYSPTPLVGRPGFSVVQVEADSTQRLWHFDPDGVPLQPVLTDVRGVGYHAWGNAHELVLFILGEPHELHRADTRATGSRRVAVDIGRSIHRVPDRANVVSFTQQLRPDDWWIRTLDLATGGLADLAPLPSGVQDYTWTPWGTMWLIEGATLREWDPEGPPRWQPVADLAPQGIADVTRVTVSGDGRWLALVAAELPAAATSDVESLDGILDALYDVVSGPAGEALDVDRLRSLFAPGAYLLGVEPGRATPTRERTFSVEDWIEEFAPRLRGMDFHEREIARRTERWAHLAQVWSTYEAVAHPEDQTPLVRGINSLQLTHDGARWAIRSVVFEGELGGNQLPEEYLPDATNEP